eukprot:CAMPEP_0119053118 /NCGR_PEP_ID=MMETSP1177-20130426/74208_1 /TAXON_ID=2985 /ORGANISM="Ochromonas sp, Strain CCMP1899" /LENGTH=453 /DNA_ID=CAMNT_0007032949 /DNA_START=102 /DNA_END=1463 /DNA_ORIENTATION=-
MNDNDDDSNLLFGKYYDNEAADDEDEALEKVRLAEEADVKTSKAKRRQIRINQRSLMDVFTDEQEALQDFNSGRFKDTRGLMNTEFDKIGHTREQHIDATLMNAQSRVLRKLAANLEDNSRRYDFNSFSSALTDKGPISKPEKLRKIAEVLRKLAANLEDNSRRYDFNSFSSALTDKFKDRQSGLFDWTKCGIDCGALFLSAPPMTIMLGPISKPEKLRKIAEKKGPRQIHEEVKPEELIQTAEEDDEATNERIQTQSRHIQSLCYPEFKPKKKNELPPTNVLCKPFDLLYNLLDPLDAVQTVENLFDFAFLIKEKQVAQKIDENGMPISLLLPGELQNADRKQMVLTMNMKDLKKLSKLVARKSSADDLSSTCPLHRNDLLYSAKNAHEQADILQQKADGKKRGGGKKRKSEGGNSSTTLSQEEDGDEEEEPTQKKSKSQSDSSKGNKKQKN